MALRCFLFSEDEKTAALIRQILDGLGVDVESCADAVAAAEKITTQAFQIVVIDWDKQPEAAVMLNTARERKAAERPLTLAMVSEDKSVPAVLQAGANSILRKPVLLNQAKDTLAMARDLIRAKQESAAGAGQAAAAAASASATKSVLPSTEAGERTLRAGEFLQSAPTAPSGQFETDADIRRVSAESAFAEPVSTLKDLETVASFVAEHEPEPAPPPVPSESKGLEWYKNRLASLQPNPELAPTLAAPKPNTKPELLGYDQPSSFPASPKAEDSIADAPPPTPKSKAASVEAHKDEQTKEAELFAYIDGERSEAGKALGSRFRLGKGMIIAALVLAAVAIAAAPQAPWHPKLRALWFSGRQSMHAWLNPQPVMPVQAPAAHEDFARPGDEYKLPVAEAIPDATTDPSQIQVVPVVDPTVKKPNNDTAGSDQPAVVSMPNPSDQPATQPAAQVPQGQPSPTTPEPVQPSGTSNVVPVSSPVPSGAGPTAPAHSETPMIPVPAASTPAPKSPPPHYASTPSNVPSSLKSQMAPTTDAGGNKPLDAAMPSIEPVQVPEAAERALLADQPVIAYPENAKGQQGTVILQVLVARDGTVQDAKFLQGSLAFARAAIDGVKQWKFKPYLMNGRPVSVQTQLTMRFNPAQ